MAQQERFREHTLVFLLRWLASFTPSHFTETLSFHVCILVFIIKRKFLTIQPNSAADLALLPPQSPPSLLAEFACHAFILSLSLIFPTHTCVSCLLCHPPSPMFPPLHQCCYLNTSTCLPSKYRAATTFEGSPGSAHHSTSTATSPKVTPRATSTTGKTNKKPQITSPPQHQHHTA